jgi:hypothetical protein
LQKRDQQKPLHKYVLPCESYSRHAHSLCMTV